MMAAGDNPNAAPKSMLDEARGIAKDDRENEAREQEQRKLMETEDRLFKEYLAQITAWDLDAAANDATLKETGKPSSGDGDMTGKEDLPQVGTPSRRPSFQLRYSLRYKTEAERLCDAVSAAAATAGKTLPSKLYTLVISFAQSKIYEQLESVRVPYLCRGPAEMEQTRKGGRRSRRSSNGMHTVNDAERDIGSITRFPFVYDISITFRPIVPLPTSFTVNATFNDEEGNICEGQMEPLHIAFTDLFQQVPIPSTFTSPQDSFAPSNTETSQLSTSFLESYPTATLLRMMWQKLWRYVSITDDRYGTAVIIS